MFSTWALCLLHPLLPGEGPIAADQRLVRFFGLPVARAFGWHVGFLAISALLFVGLIELLVENPGPWVKHGPPLAGAYVLVWLPREHQLGWG